MVLRRVLDYVVRQTGAKLIPAGYRAFRKYDIETTNRLFGKSGGKGFRHGRDLGLILGEYVGDESVDEFSPPPYTPAYPKPQARSGYKRSYSRRGGKYHRCDKYCGNTSKFRK